LHSSKEQLKSWKEKISEFLRDILKIELHPEKSKIVSLSNGIDFVGFRNFYYFKPLRKRNIENMKRKIGFFNQGELSYEKLFESLQGWNAYAKWANNNQLIGRIIKVINIS